MRLHHHTVFSVAIAGVLYTIFKSSGLAIACLISGIFIDLDHIPDYIREHGSPFKIRNFFQVCYKCRFNRIILFLHGWEWLLLSCIVAWLTNWNPWTTGLFIGLSQHMILDAIYNSPGVWTYSLLWRWKNSFDFETTFGKNPRCISKK